MFETTDKPGIEAECSKCGTTEKNKRGYCKECDRRRAAAWKAANKARIAEWGVVYRAANREEILEKKRADWERTKDEVNARRRAERAASPEPVRRLQRESYYRNRETAKARMRSNYARNRVERQAQQQAWRRSNLALVRAGQRAWEAANPHKVRSIKAAWKQRNPEATRAYGHTRRVRKRIDGGRLSPDIAIKLYRLQRGKCACCAKPLWQDYHLDHIEPIARGGRNVDANIQLLRSRCNISKGAKPPEQYMQSKGFLL